MLPHTTEVTDDRIVCPARADRRRREVTPRERPAPGCRPLRAWDDPLLCQLDDLNCHGVPTRRGREVRNQQRKEPRMRTRLLTVVSLALVLMALALPARAAGAETLHVKFQGQTAQAEFSSTNGCVQTVVYISQEDVCTQTQLVDAFGFAVLAPDEFQIDEQFTAATLTATIEVSDFTSGTAFPVHVSVSWTGFGDTFSQDDCFHLKTPGFKVNFHLDGTFRQAAASGTVSDGTTNFTPERALLTGNTRLGSIKVGEVDIIHQ